jgi:hypothetical protein
MEKHSVAVNRNELKTTLNILYYGFTLYIYFHHHHYAFMTDALLFRSTTLYYVGGGVYYFALAVKVLVQHHLHLTAAARPRLDGIFRDQLIRFNSIMDVVT